MKRKILKFIVLTLSVLVLTLIFAVPSSAENETFYVGDSGDVSINIPSGAQVTSWSCTPYGYVTFKNQTSSGNTYSTEMTAELPGTVTIKATVKYADNTTEIVTVKTFSNVLDGIYTVQNNYTDQYFTGGTYYLRSQTTYPTTLPFSVAQHSQNDFGDMRNRIFNHWKLEHLGNGEYVIRSMADCSKIINYSGGEVSIYTIITGTIPNSARWYINGNYIKPKTDTTKCLALASSSHQAQCILKVCIIVILI